MPMTDQEWEMLLVQQEKAKKRIEDIEKDLKRRGEALVKLGLQVRDRPDQVVFSDAPSPLGNIPHHMLSIQGFEWSQTLHALNLEAIAQAVQDLRDARTELFNLDTQAVRD